MRPWLCLAKLPLGAASFAFFQITRWLLIALVRAARKPGHAWRTLPEVLRQPLALAYIMVTGPRWNTHASIAGVGPFRVERRLRIDIAGRPEPAAAWTLVIYRSGAMQTVTAIDSTSADRRPGGVELAVEPGLYSGVLRCYGPRPDGFAPAIEVDGRPLVPARALPPDGDYLEALRDRRSLFYLLLHHHVHVMLRCRALLPDALVHRVLLPVGNPETSFRYGAIEQGQVLTVDRPGGVPRGYRIYLTVYNRASFPVTWTELRVLRHATPPITATGFFLLRIHRVAPSAEPMNPSELQLAIS